MAFSGKSVGNFYNPGQRPFPWHSFFISLYRTVVRGQMPGISASVIQAFWRENDIMFFQLPTIYPSIPAVSSA